MYLVILEHRPDMSGLPSWTKTSCDPYHLLCYCIFKSFLCQELGHNSNTPTWYLLTLMIDLVMEDLGLVRYLSLCDIRPQT
jgi:hypothetical protein